MKRNSLPLFALTLTLLLSACGAGSASPTDNATGAAAPSAGVSQDAVAGEDGSDLWMPSSTEIEMAQSDVYTDPDAKIIRTAELIIQTTDFGQSVSALAQLTEEQGGYYETAQIQEGGYQCELEIDGGVKQTNVVECIEAGADVIVAGSAVFGGDIAANVKGFLGKFEEGAAKAQWTK